MKRKQTFIIAELSANHNGSLELAKETIIAAKRAGADAIKFQTYTADTITLNCHKSDFKINGGLWNGRYLYELYQEAYTPWEWHAELFAAAHREGIVAFSTPFDFSAVDFLEDLNNPIYKIASFEITDIPLIKYCASKQKPMIISTGIATIEDIERAVDACREVGNMDITLLKCTSSYPAPIEKANLSMIADMATRFGVKVGLSDHTMGNVAAITAVALGATVIEKHFILDRSLGGVDAAFSMNEAELKEMIMQIRLVEQSIGSINYPTDPQFIEGRCFARSLYVSRPILKGEVITNDNIRSVRPGFGLLPYYIDKVLGKKVNQNLEIGDRISLDIIE